MAGNRVDDLEAKVQELEATINGLTDELVETKERLHALEGDDGTPDILEGRPTRSEAAEETASEPAAEAEPEESPEDDGEASAEEGMGEEADGEDEADSESGDDIIVA